MKITEVPCKCECGWTGTVWDCEPDIDGNGSLGCPKCGKVVDAKEPSSSRKIARIQISVEVLTEMLRGYTRPIIATDAPKDLQVISINQSAEDVALRRFTVWAESESFGLIPEGGAIPFVSFWYKHYHDEDWQP